MIGNCNNAHLLLKSRRSPQLHQGSNAFASRPQDLLRTQLPLVDTNGAAFLLLLWLGLDQNARTLSRQKNRSPDATLTDRPLTPNRSMWRKSACQIPRCHVLPKVPPWQNIAACAGKLFGENPRSRPMTYNARPKERISATDILYWSQGIARQ